MTSVKPEPEDAPQRVARWWSVALVPILFFLSGSFWFGYEVLVGHDTTFGLLAALWAAGGPALVADKLLRMWVR